jgi:hypothetical protein
MNLAGRGAARTNTAPRRSRPTPTRPAALALVELIPAAASAKDVAGGRYVLEVAGARLEFDDGCSVATLRRVLEALRSC